MSSQHDPYAEFYTTPRLSTPASGDPYAQFYAVPKGPNPAKPEPNDPYAQFYSSPSPPPTHATPETPAGVEAMVRAAAATYGVDPDIASRVAQRESNYRQEARSHAGAIGVMQLMPPTARMLGVNPTDLRQNIDGGIRYLKQLYDRYGGNWRKALAAYNAGPGRFDEAMKTAQALVQKGRLRLPGGAMSRAPDWLPLMPLETQRYVKGILGTPAPSAAAPKSVPGPGPYADFFLKPSRLQEAEAAAAPEFARAGRDVAVLGHEAAQTANRLWRGAPPNPASLVLAGRRTAPILTQPTRPTLPRTGAVLRAATPYDLAQMNPTLRAATPQEAEAMNPPTLLQRAESVGRAVGKALLPGGIVQQYIANPYMAGGPGGLAYTTGGLAEEAAGRLAGQAVRKAAGRVAEEPPVPLPEHEGTTPALRALENHPIRRPGAVPSAQSAENFLSRVDALAHARLSSLPDASARESIPRELNEAHALLESGHQGEAMAKAEGVLSYLHQAEFRSQHATHPSPMERPEGSPAGAIAPGARAAEAIPGLARRALQQSASASRIAHTIEDRLYLLDQSNVADAATVRKMLSQPEIRDMPESEQEAMTHYGENRAEPIAPALRMVYEHTVRPMLNEISRVWSKVKDRGLGTESDDWLTRRVISGGKQQPFEEVDGGTKGTLRKSAGFLRRRTMKALTDDQGNRFVASVKNGRVTVWRNGTPEDAGALRQPTLEDLRRQELRPVERRLHSLKQKLRALESVGQSAPEKVAALETQLDDLTSGLEGVARDTGVPVETRIARQRRQIAQAMSGLRALRGPAYDAARLRERVHTLNRQIDDLLAIAHDIDARYDPENLNQKVFVAGNGPLAGKRFRIGDATIKEIEANTPYRYSKRIFEVVAHTWLRARQIERASDLLDSLKQDPEFQDVAMQVPKGSSRTSWPEGWVPTKLRQFPAPSEVADGWVFTPKVAAVLDQYAGALRSNPSLLDGLNRAIVSLIFTNPLAHYPNMLTTWFIASGAQQLARPVALVRKMTKAFNMVKNEDPEFLDLVIRGHPGELVKLRNRRFFSQLSERIGAEGHDPEVSSTLRNIVHYNPMALLNHVSNLMTWLGDDVLRTETVLDLQDRGLTRSQALAETNRIIPDYRVPAFLDLPGGPLADRIGIEAGKLLNNQMLFMFQRYHTSLLRSLAQMGRGVINEEAPGERFRNVQRLGALALTMMLIQPMADRWARKITGDRNAYVRRPGMTTPIYDLSRAIAGTVTPSQALQSMFTPSPSVDTIAALLSGRNLYTGQSQGLGQALMSAAFPIENAIQMGKGERTPGQYVGSLLGLNTPKLSGTEARLVFQDRDLIASTRSQVMKDLRTGKVRQAHAAWDALLAKIKHDHRAAVEEEVQNGALPDMTASEMDAYTDRYLHRMTMRGGLLAFPTPSAVERSTRTINRIPTLPPPVRHRGGGFGSLHL